MMIECDGWAGADCTDKVAGNILLLICFGICLCRCLCLCLCLLTVLSSFNDCPHLELLDALVGDAGHHLNHAACTNEKHQTIRVFLFRFLFSSTNKKHHTFSFFSVLFLHTRKN